VGERAGNKASQRKLQTSTNLASPGEEAAYFILKCKNMKAFTLEYIQTKNKLKGHNSLYKELGRKSTTAPFFLYKRRDLHKKLRKSITFFSDLHQLVVFLLPFKKNSTHQL
jgi:hypothetical protein